LNISVVIPAYNAEGTISETLNALLHQKKIPREIIVVDNGSSDKTAVKVKEFAKTNPSLNIILDKEIKKGPSAARNKGASLASNNTIAFLDADCIPPVNWIEIIDNEFSGGCEIAGGTYEGLDTTNFIGSYLNIIGKASFGKREAIGARVEDNRFLLGGTFAVSKSLFFKAGKFDEEMRLGEDADLCKRIYKIGKRAIYNPELTVVHDHREEFKCRFQKTFSSGLLEARFLKKYYCTGFNIFFFGGKVIHFNSPIRTQLYFFSVINILLVSAIVSFFNKWLAMLILASSILGIALKVLNITAKSGVRVNLFSYIGILLYWTLERFIFDVGRLCGSVKYRVACI